MTISKGDRWINSTHEFEFFKFGEHALLLQWPAARDRPTLDRITAVQHTLTHMNIKGVIEMVPAYHSLTLYFIPNVITHDELIDVINHEDKFAFHPDRAEEVVTIPVNYHTSFAVDIENVSKILELSIPELINIHTSPVYDVHFIGFLPGFLYLGGLDKKLNIPRRPTPRIRVPAGAVAIANGQTGIYPVDSPGGWHIIGHTNHELFNPALDPPCSLSPGMKVKFKAIEL